MTPLARRHPYIMPFFLASLGVGICGWYGLEWYELPQYTQEDIEASTEANLAIDLQRLGPNLQPDKERLERLRARVREEVEIDIRRQRTSVQRSLSIGLICIVLAMGQLVFVYLVKRDSK